MMKKRISNRLLWVCYAALLAGLFGTVCAVPILVEHGAALTPGFVIEEDVLETILIFSLFVVSFLIYKAVGRQMLAYRNAVKRSRARQSTLTSRLSEAFHYIGTINVELNHIMTGLCGVHQYPLTKRELKHQFQLMAIKMISIAQCPWGVVRMIHRNSGRTIKEYAFELQKGTLPKATLGNRAILEGRPANGMQTIGTCQDNLVVYTVFIFPEVHLAQEQLLLIAAIVNQIEMLFLLYHPAFFLHNNTPEYRMHRRVGIRTP